MWLARLLQHPGCLARPPFLASFCLFSSFTAGRIDTPAPPPAPTHFMVDYLVNSCGLSGLEALRASKHLTHLKSHEKPDAVLLLLRQVGLDDAQIRLAVQKFPRVLCVKPYKTLEPKIRVLQGAGFSGSEVGQLISSNPSNIYIRDLPHRLEFWMRVFGTKQNVLKACKKAPDLLFYSLNGRVIPRLSLLRDWGIPDDKLGKLILKRPRWVYMKSDWIKNQLEQLKDMGFSPDSGMFLQAFLSVGNVSRAAIDAKSKLLKSFGWTQLELISAIHKFPNLLVCSEKKIQGTMYFLLNEAGCEPSYVARRPALVGYSMEKRLMPRNYVLQYLKNRGLSSRAKDLWTAMHISDHNFIQKFVVPYKDHIPELLEAYHAVLSSQDKSQH